MAATAIVTRTIPAVTKAILTLRRLDTWSISSRLQPGPRRVHRAAFMEANGWRRALQRRTVGLNRPFCRPTEACLRNQDELSPIRPAAKRRCRADLRGITLNSRVRIRGHSRVRVLMLGVRVRRIAESPLGARRR